MRMQKHYRLLIWHHVHLKSDRKYSDIQQLLNFVKREVEKFFK